MSQRHDGETYLGDGVYASFDRHQFRLRAPRPGVEDHVIYLDPETYLKLRTFVEESALWHGKAGGK